VESEGSTPPRSSPFREITVPQRDIIAGAFSRCTWNSNDSEFNQPARPPAPKQVGIRAAPQKPRVVGGHTALIVPPLQFGRRGLLFLAEPFVPKLRYLQVGAMSGPKCLGYRLRSNRDCHYGLWYPLRSGASIRLTEKTQQFAASKYKMTLPPIVQASVWGTSS
jgi:hypothetical protein